MGTPPLPLQASFIPIDDIAAVGPLAAVPTILQVVSRRTFARHLGDGHPLKAVHMELVRETELRMSCGIPIRTRLLS